MSDRTPTHLNAVCRVAIKSSNAELLQKERKKVGAYCISFAWAQLYCVQCFLYCNVAQSSVRLSRMTLSDDVLLRKLYELEHQFST
jgi:hypothetical protein